MAHARLGYVRVNGTRLYCSSAGEGPTVLLLHGFPETHRSWDLQVPFLVDHGFRVVAPDLRGYGESDRVRHGYDIGTLAGDVAALVDELGGRVALVGHDWGGGIAWEVASRYPEKLSRVVVLDCPHPLVMARALESNLRQIRRSWYIFFFQLPRLPELWLSKRGGRNLGRMFRRSPGAERAPETIVAAARSALTDGDDALYGPLAYYRMAFREGLRLRSDPARSARYRPIELPLAMIWGEHDSCLGLELAEQSQRWVTKPRLEVVAGAGHFVHQEAPDVVNRLLLELLAPTRDESASVAAPRRS